MKDYCVYWFRKAHDHLTADQRAGLVGTNSISQNRARSVSLEYVTANSGVITDAISTQKWPGEANVHVSLVNWVKRPTVVPAKFTLDGESVSGISAELRTPEHSTGQVAPRLTNKRKCYQGPVPVGDGFIFSRDEAADLLATQGANYRDVVRPYLTSSDIADSPTQTGSRWIIDFAQMPLEYALTYKAAIDLVRDRVKPFRDTVSRERRREKWWQFGESGVGLRSAIAGLDRYIAGIRHGKRLLFVWCDPWTLASDATNTFAFSDDYAMGVLSSHPRGVARSRSSTLEDRLRYTPSSVFETFPWPDPVTEKQRERIADAIREIIAMRQQICAANSFGLTTLYNLVDEGAYTDLKVLHRELDEAVAAAYGWPKAVAQDGDEIVQRLLILNREITAGTREYNPFDEELKLIDSVQVDPRLTPESVPVQRRGQVPTEEVVRGSPHQR